MDKFLATRKYVTDLFQEYNEQKKITKNELLTCDDGVFKVVLNNDWQRIDAIMYILEKIGDYMDDISSERGCL